MTQYVYYQPNKHATTDCAIRALTKALDMPWKQTFLETIPHCLELQEVPNSKVIIDKVLTENGWKWQGIKVKSGNMRPTIGSWNKKGEYVFRLASHVAYVKDLKLYDIWDCRNKAIYGYWYKIK
ncbi:MAG: hypothetical protein IJS60_08920 [Abditibacteriota bacterium]|nr:hypothetical protein [Abditibacteriota bacterium]